MKCTPGQLESPISSGVGAQGSAGECLLLPHGEHLVTNALPWGQDASREEGLGEQRPSPASLDGGYFLKGHRKSRHTHVRVCGPFGARTASLSRLLYGPVGSSCPGLLFPCLLCMWALLPAGDPHS